MHPENYEKFKNSKPRVQFYWFLKKECAVCLMTKWRSGFKPARAGLSNEAWKNTTTGIHTKMQLLPRWLKTSKIKNLFIIFVVVMSLFACTPFSHMPLFVTNFGYPPLSLYPGDVIFEWLFIFFTNSILDVWLGSEYTSGTLF